MGLATGVDCVNWGAMVVASLYDVGGRLGHGVFLAFVLFFGLGWEKRWRVRTGGLGEQKLRNSAWSRSVENDPACCLLLSMGNHGCVWVSCGMALFFPWLAKRERAQTGTGCLG